ncbi:MAG: hypothetical protein WAV55_07260, partial [Clostridiaceae bacterium]
STLQEKLQEKGYSGKHMAIYAGGGIATRRFQMRSRNKLWHSDYPDILFIPMLRGKTSVYCLYVAGTSG